MVMVLISYRTLSWILGVFLLTLAGAMLAPLAFSALTDRADLGALALATLICAAAAAVLLLVGRGRARQDLRSRESILLVVLVWLAVCTFGSLPFYFSEAYHSFSDAVFEATSGFTTTGATVLADVDALSAPLHLWRSLSHWLGGMGIVLLGLAVLPLLDQNGSGLYRAEFSGSVAERLRPRIVETARALWKIYVLMTAAEFVLLLLAGMGPFDALCHAFSTMATGGFSTRTASIGAYENPIVEYIVVVFMLLAGISFIQHFRLWAEGRFRQVFTDYEVRTYLLIVLVVTTLITLTLLLHGERSLEPALRAALFQVVSILTTTGFVTDDYALWTPVAQLLLLLLMFIGGCTGSTAGGLKVSRFVLMLGVIKREFRRRIEPQGVFRVRAGDVAVSEQTVSSLLNLVFLALLLLVVASLIVAATGVDVLTAITAVVACQFNIGPGLSGVGPAENFGGFAPLAKWVLSLSMVAGRLEFYTLLVLFSSMFWRR